MREWNQLTNVLFIAIIAYGIIRGIMAALRKRPASDGTKRTHVTETLPSFYRVATRDTFTLVLFVPTALLAFIAACGTADPRFFSSSFGIGVCLLFCLFFGISWIRCYSLRKLHRAGAIIQGEILGISTNIFGYQADIRYAYWYKEKRFGGSRNCAFAEQFAKGYDVGSSITVAVDPGNPYDSDVLDIYL